MKLVGITGGLGSGKTTIAGYFKNLGSTVIDADKVTHAVLLNKRIKGEIVATFGKGVLKNGRVNRKKLAKIVFNNKGNLRKLCNIVHPPILKRIRSFIRDSKGKITVIDGPLLIESGLHREMDKIIVVSINKKDQISRCIKLGYSKNRAEKRTKTQMPLRQKLRYADFIIDNNGSKLEAKRQVAQIWRKLNENGG